LVSGYLTGPLRTTPPASGDLSSITAAAAVIDASGPWYLPGVKSASAPRVYLAEDDEPFSKEDITPEEPKKKKKGEEAPTGPTLVGKARPSKRPPSRLIVYQVTHVNSLRHYNCSQ
jgi:hypothetical protein